MVISPSGSRLPLDLLGEPDARAYSTPTDRVRVSWRRTVVTCPVVQSVSTLRSTTAPRKLPSGLIPVCGPSFGGWADYRRFAAIGRSMSTVRLRELGGVNAWLSRQQMLILWWLRKYVPFCGSTRPIGKSSLTALFSETLHSGPLASETLSSACWAVISNLMVARTFQPLLDYSGCADALRHIRVYGNSASLMTVNLTSSCASS